MARPALAILAAGWLAAGAPGAAAQTPPAPVQAPLWPTAALQGAAEPPDAACAQAAPATLDWPAAQARLTRCNRELRVALLAAEAQRADVRIAGQRPNPTLSAGLGNVNPVSGVGSGNPLDLQVDYVARIDQLFERGDKRRLRVESAGHAWRAARFNAAETMRQQQFALAQAWIDLWGAQRRLALQDELIGLYERTLSGAQRRLSAGDVAAADVARIGLDVERARAERVQAEAARTRARNAVAALLALEPTTAGALQAGEPWPALDAGAAPDGVLASAEAAGRPDLEAARAQQAAAESQSRLAQALAVRDVSVGVQAERYAPPAGNGWLLGAYVAIPLFVHHRFEGEIARAEAERATAEQTRRRLEAVARGEQLRALDALAAARARRERLERDALPLAEKVAANAELAWRKGAGTVLELLDALRQLRALQLDALEARLETDRADAAARAEMLTAAAAADPVFGEALRLQPDTP
jgi:cobalt-zinc-cadmium efflux system outer membrane protein